MLNAFWLDQEKGSVIKVKCVGIRQGEAKEMSVLSHRLASSSCKHNQTGGVQCLMTLSVMRWIKGHEKHKGQILTSLPSILGFSPYKYESSSSIVPVTEHTSAGGQSILVTAHPTCKLCKLQRCSDEGF